MTDQELQARIAEAREAGYSDQEIQQYLESQNRGMMPSDASLAPSTSVDRSQELAALAQYGGAKAAEYAAYGAGGAYAGKKILDAYRAGRTPPPVAPVAPSATPPLEPGGQRLVDFTRAQPPGNPPAASQSPVATQSSQSIKQQIQQRALQAVQSPATNRMAGLASRGLGALGALLYSPGLNANEDEQLRRLRAEQDEMRRRAQMR